MERRRLPEACFLVLALLLPAWFYGAMDLAAQDGSIRNIAAPCLGYAGMVLLLFAVFQWTRKYVPPSGNASRTLLLLLGLTLVPRILWWLAVPPATGSDYGLYVRLAREYAESGRIEPDAYLLTIAPNAALYAAVLGWVMRMFGTDIGVAQGFCVVLHVANVLLLYGVGREMTSRRRAFWASAAFSLLPENIFYSTLPGIEALSMFTILAGMLSVLHSGNGKGWKACALPLAGGALLAFSACVRASAWAAAAAAVWLLLKRRREGETLRDRLISLLYFALGMVLVLWWHHGFQGWIFGGLRPAAGLGWPLYEGLDLESGGRWTEEKSKRCIELIESLPPRDADRVLWQEATERFRAYSLPEKIRLFLRKGGTLWFDSRYSVYSLEWTESLRPAEAVATGSWGLCLAAWNAALLLRWKEPLFSPARSGCVACMILILLTCAWHQAGTSIGRYHYMLIPFVLLMLMMLLPEGKTTGRKVKPWTCFRH